MNALKVASVFLKNINKIYLIIFLYLFHLFTPAVGKNVLHCLRQLICLNLYNIDNEFCVVFFVEWTESEDTMCWILSLPWLQVRLRGVF